MAQSSSSTWWTKREKKKYSGTPFWKTYFDTTHQKYHTSHLIFMTTGWYLELASLVLSIQFCFILITFLQSRNAFRKYTAPGRQTGWKVEVYVLLLAGFLWFGPNSNRSLQSLMCWLSWPNQYCPGIHFHNHCTLVILPNFYCSI